MSRCLLQVASLILLAACDTSPALLADAKLDVSFPSRRPDGTLPFAPGGPFRVRVRAEVPNLCSSTRARVELVAPAFPKNAVTESVATLHAIERCSVVEGEASLAAPEGGPLKVRVSALGRVQEYEVTMDVPRVAVRIDEPSRDATSLRFPVCIESSATRGTLNLKATGAFFEGWTATRTIALEDGGCSPTPIQDFGGITHAQVDVLGSGEPLEVTAELQDTAASNTATSSAPSLGKTTLQISTVPATLPMAGDLVEVIVSVRLGGVAVENVPVTFETVPPTSLNPVLGISGEDGTVRTYVLVPIDVSAMRIDAVSGPVREGVTLRHAP